MRVGIWITLLTACLAPNLAVAETSRVGVLPRLHEVMTACERAVALADDAPFVAIELYRHPAQGPDEPDRGNPAIDIGAGYFAVVTASPSAGYEFCDVIGYNAWNGEMVLPYDVGVATAVDWVLEVGVMGPSAFEGIICNRPGRPTRVRIYDMEGYQRRGSITPTEFPDGERPFAFVVTLLDPSECQTQEGVGS